MTPIGTDTLSPEDYAIQRMAEAAAKRAHGPVMRFPTLPGVQPIAATPGPVGTRPGPVAAESIVLKNNQPEPPGEFRDLHQVVPPNLTPNIPVPVAEVRTFKVRLDHTLPAGEETGFSLDLEVTDVNESDSAISLALVSTTRFRPNMGMRFKLTVGDRTYDVAYTGGTFEFPRLRVNGLVFVRVV